MVPPARPRGKGQTVYWAGHNAPATVAGPTKWAKCHSKGVDRGRRRQAATHAAATAAGATAVGPRSTGSRRARSPSTTAATAMPVVSSASRLRNACCQAQAVEAGTPADHRVGPNNRPLAGRSGAERRLSRQQAPPTDAPERPRSSVHGRWGMGASKDRWCQVGGEPRGGPIAELHPGGGPSSRPWRLSQRATMSPPGAAGMRERSCVEPRSRFAESAW